MDDSGMTVSVCMATYNGERYIGEQIKSIMPQLQDNDELIISDDSSTDQTIPIIKTLKDPRIRLYANNVFSDPIYNFENAIRHSTGDLIVLSDQDDIWLDDKLETLRSKFVEKPPRIALVVVDGLIINEYSDIIAESIFEKLRSGKGIVKNLYNNTYMGCCMAFSRQLLRIALPFPRKIPMHDSWLGLLAEIYGTVEFVPIKTIKYRRHGLSRSLQRVSIAQQLKWRILLAYHLIRKVRSQPPGRLRPSPQSILS